MTWPEQDPYSSPPYQGTPQSSPPAGQYPQYPQQQYPQQQYPQQPQGPAYGYVQPAAPSTNTMAIVSLVLAFAFWPGGVVCGHIAKKQIRQTGEQGSGLATAGLVISYIFGGLTLLWCGAVVLLMIVADSSTY